jgi:hypothetical protein
MTKTVAKGGSNYSAPIATLLRWKSAKPASCTHLVATWAISRLTVEFLIETDRYRSADTGSPVHSSGGRRANLPADAVFRIRQLHEPRRLIVNFQCESEILIWYWSRWRIMASNFWETMAYEWPGQKDRVAKVGHNGSYAPIAFMCVIARIRFSDPQELPSK